MVENGGALSTGQRLERIEKHLEGFENKLEGLEESIMKRITKHREVNEQQLEKLAATVLKDFNQRVTKLETESAIEAAQRSSKRWIIATSISLGVLLIMCVGLLIQVLWRVS